jgi:hypothetical protein
VSFCDANGFEKEVAMQMKILILASTIPLSDAGGINKKKGPSPRPQKLRDAPHAEPQNVLIIS